MVRVPNAGQIEYMEAHKGDDLRRAFITADILCGVAAYTGVAMRMISRRLVRAGYKADDWLILGCLAMYTGYIIVESLATVWGAGRHVIFITNAKALAMSFLTTECFYCAAIFCTKLSILCLYNRIFPQRWFKNASLGVAAFITAWYFTATFVSIFQCVPIASQWDPAVSGQCINNGSSARVIGIVNIITDFVLLGLPMPLVWRIQISITKKWQLTVTFMLGGCACIVSIIRLFFVENVGNTADPSWDDMPGGFCSTVELCVGILAACIATWRPLFNRITNRSAKFTIGSGNSNSKATPLGITPRNQPEQIRMSVKPNGVLSRTRDSDDKERLYTQMPEAMEDPVDKSW